MPPKKLKASAAYLYSMPREPMNQYHDKNGVGFVTTPSGYFRYVQEHPARFTPSFLESILPVVCLMSGVGLIGFLAASAL